MKKTYAIILLATFVLSIAGKIGIFISFKINQEYIAQNICENRFNKDSCCKGSCYLAKQLEETGDKQAPHSSLKSLQKADDFIHYDTFTSLAPSLTTTTSIAYPQYVCDYFFTFTSGIFHPPSFSFLS